ncbi:Lactamase B domain containing protein [Pyrenophora teres f. maculata]|nr:Lactamase B domain containing protein [Pyrenophora teres f. maculata]
MKFKPSDLAICETCGTQFDVPLDQHPESCRICDDPRQYVPASGQTWTSLRRSQPLQKNNFETDAQNPHIHYITTAPLSPSELPPGLADTSSTRKQLGIGQRAILLQTSGGNVLWDCVAFLNPDTISFVNSKGGLKAIVISHPHFYTIHLEWAAVFKCPVYMAGEDQEWINRADKDGARKFFSAGEETKIEESGFKNAKHVPETTSYSFMWAYPNMIPLSPKAILGIWKAIKGLEFDSTYGGFPGQNLSRPDLKAQVLESMKIFLRRGGHEGAEIYGESV